MAKPRYRVTSRPALSASSAVERLNVAAAPAFIRHLGGVRAPITTTSPRRSATAIATQMPTASAFSTPGPYGVEDLHASSRILPTLSGELRPARALAASASG